MKYNLEKINNSCNQKADYELFLKEFQEINSNILTIKTNLNLSGSYSKNEEIIDIINIPNQLISALINLRIDQFNQIYDLIKTMKENINDEIEIIQNTYFLCSKIKLIFLKAVLKSILLENQDNPDNFFYLHNLYNFKDLYYLFSDQDFFKEYLIENILKSKLPDLRSEELNVSEFDYLKINSFVLFKISLCKEYFCNRMEKLKYNLEAYFCREKSQLKNENLMCKDFYSINDSIEQMTIKFILLIKNVLKEIIGILVNEENNVDSEANQGISWIFEFFYFYLKTFLIN